MQKQLTKITTEEFNGVKVAFRLSENGQSEVRIDEVAKFCGWTTIAKSGNEIIRWARVNEKLTELGVTKLGNGDFIPEYIMYPLIGKANNDKATEFMLWVGKVLVDIRVNGAYVSQKITPEQEKKLDLFSTPLKRRNTLLNTPIETLEETIKECMEYNKRKTAKEKIVILKHIMKVIEERKELSTSAGLSFMLADILTNISKNITSTSNRKNGCIVRSKNKEIESKDNFIVECKEYINYIDPELESLTKVNVHPFGLNSMYEPVISKITGEAIDIKTVAYKAWIRTFPNFELKGYEHVDFNKPVGIWIRFDCLSKFDCDGLIKSFIDQVARHYNNGEDENVHVMEATVNSYVESYAEGKIYFKIYNI